MSNELVERANAILEGVTDGPWELNPVYGGAGYVPLTASVTRPVA